jgi:CBS domain containing-hemolysin-like protein
MTIRPAQKSQRGDGAAAWVAKWQRAQDLLAWPALLGGPLAGAILVVVYVAGRIGEMQPPGAGAVVLHTVAALLVLLAVPGTLALLRAERPGAKRAAILAWVVWVLPCAAWVLNSMGVVLGR